jgi:hypothetical protein
MPFTLWRGGRLLGALHVREPQSARATGARRLSAIPLPSSDAAGGLGGVTQSRVDVLPGRPLLEYPLDPIVDEEPIGRTTRDASRVSIVTLTPAGEEERRGIAPESQLRVRNEAGRVLGTPHLSLREFRPRPGTEAEVMAGYPGAALNDGRVWLVEVALDLDDVDA